SQSTNIELRHADRLVVSGNTIYDGRQMGIEAENCQQLILASNTFGWSRGREREMNDGIRLVRCRGANVTGLVLSQSRAGSESAGGAVTLIDCDDAAVSGCQVLAPRWRGISLENC